MQKHTNEKRGTRSYLEEREHSKKEKKGSGTKMFLYQGIILVKK
jgi:hypothetical protein